jgi:phosphate transport system substrate-binding protein
MHTRISPARASMLRAMLALACVLSMGSSLAGTTIKTGGTGSAIGALAALGATFKQSHPDTDVVMLKALGSSGAIKALGAQALDLAASARPLKPAERSQHLEEMEVARTPLVFAGAKTYPGLTLAKVADILEGKQETWPDGSALRLILRPQHDSETALLGAVSPAMGRAVGNALARPGMHIALTDDEAVTSLQTVPGALGLTTLAMIVSASPPIRALPLDGITPNLATLNNGRYRLSKPMYLIVREDAPEPVRAFVSFIRSPRGAGILARHGFQSLATAKRD